MSLGCDRRTLHQQNSGREKAPQRLYGASLREDLLLQPDFVPRWSLTTHRGLCYVEHMSHITRSRYRPPPAKSSTNFGRTAKIVFTAIAAVLWLAAAFGLTSLALVYPLVGIPLFFLFFWLSFSRRP